jgi:hypothetical protein
MTAFTAFTPLTDIDLQRWRACPRRFQLLRGQPAAPDDLGLPADETVPLPVLRASFPGAQVIATPRTAQDWAAALQHTAQALANLGPDQAIFGACLASDDGVQVRVDVLAGGERGLRLIRPRLATVGQEADLDRVALWAHVAARQGLRLQSVGLWLVDTDFTYPGLACHAGLFREVDLGPSLGSRPVAQWLVALQAMARSTTPPAIAPDAPCHADGGCACLATCGVPPAADPLADPLRLEIVGRELGETLRAEGHANLLSVPAERLDDPRHRRALRAIQSDRPVLEPAAGPLLRLLPRPLRVLRMDTIGFAIPLFPGTQPYQVLPFQWSCDLREHDGRWAHSSHLAGPGADPRQALAEALLQALGSEGAILAYNAGFERNRLRELARDLPHLAPALDALQPRIVDLFQIARSHWYHPAMRGAWSFKAVMRALAPELGVDRFDAGGLQRTPEAFARSLAPGLDETTRQTLRRALLDHGRREALALRRMVELFLQADQPSPATPTQRSDHGLSNPVQVTLPGRG